MKKLESPGVCLVLTSRGRREGERGEEGHEGTKGSTGDGKITGAREGT